MDTPTQDTNVKKTITIEINDKEIFKNALSDSHAIAYKELIEAERKLESFRFKLLREALDGKLPSEDGDRSYSSLFHKTGDCDFSWDCPTSPIGTCVYDSYADQAWDSCLFCYDPYERK